MKKIILTSIVLIFGIGLFGVAVAEAETPTKSLRSMPATFRTFYTAFRTAVIRRDKQAVARLTRFPFRYGWDAGDDRPYRLGREKIRSPESSRNISGCRRKTCSICSSNRSESGNGCKVYCAR